MASECLSRRVHRGFLRGLPDGNHGCPDSLPGLGGNHGSPDNLPGSDGLHGSPDSLPGSDGPRGSPGSLPGSDGLLWFHGPEPKPEEPGLPPPGPAAYSLPPAGLLYEILLPEPEPVSLQALPPGLSSLLQVLPELPAVYFLLPAGPWEPQERPAGVFPARLPGQMWLWDVPAFRRLPVSPVSGPGVFPDPDGPSGCCSADGIRP